MKKILLLLVFSHFLFSCEKYRSVPVDEYNLHGGSKIKTIKIFSSSSDSQPYALNSYTYDENLNLIKILISDYPEPVFASWTYEYSDKGFLLNKKYNAIEGQNSPDQSESDFSLIREYKYDYQSNNQVELVYSFNVLKDSIVYSYMNNLMISEYHYDSDGGNNWKIVYDYDSNANKIKETLNPDGSYKIYKYEGSMLKTSSEYDQKGKLLAELIFVYTKLSHNIIVESHYKGPYGEYVSEKTTYNNGNMIENIKYHPTFPGSEWYCQRYEYY